MSSPADGDAERNVWRSQPRRRILRRCSCVYVGKMLLAVMVFAVGLGFMMYLLDGARAKRVILPLMNE